LIALSTLIMIGLWKHHTTNFRISEFPSRMFHMVFIRYLRTVKIPQNTAHGHFVPNFSLPTVVIFKIYITVLQALISPEGFHVSYASCWFPSGKTNRDSGPTWERYIVCASVRMCLFVCAYVWIGHYCVVQYRDIQSHTQCSFLLSINRAGSTSRKFPECVIHSKAEFYRIYFRRDNYYTNRKSGNRHALSKIK